MISQKTRSSLTVTIGAILVVAGTFLLVAFASGYNIDFLRGEIVTTGLAILNTNPGGATIKVNDKTLAQKTPYRLEGLKTGPLKVEYSKADFHDWSTNYFVKAREVTFADYALLIPNVIKTEQLESQLNFSSIHNSGDGTKVFGFTTGPTVIYEIKTDNQLRRIAEIPVDVSLNSAASVQPIDTTPDGSAMIVQANYTAGKPTIFWTNSSNGELVNLTSILPDSAQRLRINPRNNREVLAISTGRLLRINTESRAITTSPLNNIASYNLDNENIYTLENLTPSTTGQFLVRYDLAGNNRYVLSQEEPMNIAGEISISKLHRQSNIALLNPDNGQLKIVRQLDGKTLTSTIGVGIKLPSFSRNGRFISFAQDDTMRTLDIEFAERFNVTQTNIGSILWLTEFQLLLNKPDGTYVVDYTGENLVKIPPNTTPPVTTQTAINKNGKHVYYIDGSKLHTYSLEPKGGLVNFR